MNNIFSNNMEWSIGIIVILFGIIAANRLTFWRSRYDRHIMSGKSLLESFDFTIKEINKYEGQFYLLEDVLRSEFEKQIVSIREFKRQLDLMTTIRFNRACRNYYGKYDDSPDFRQYVMSKDVQSVLLKRINAITKFAEK